MDWKRFDAFRRNAGPVEVDLVEAYAQNRIGRRDFLRRGAIIGLSLPAMAGIIAACGSDDDTAAGGSEGGAEESGGGDSGGDTGTNNNGRSAVDPDGPSGGTLKVGIQTGDANSGLDPLNMLDLGTYSVLSSTFEYLVGVGEDGNIGNTGLAADWSPNEDGTAWTFNLREGVMWHDGTPFTSADVAATVDRIVEVAAGLADVVSAGAVETPDDMTAIVNLDNANGNLPVLLSIYNPQSLMTPADYSNGTTLDERPGGTGPWIFEGHDPTTFTTTYTPNADYWGGAPKLDAIELIGFDSEGARVAAMQARELDVIQSFGTVDGSSLLDDGAFTVLTPPSANHRQLWFNTQAPEGGAFTDARVRRAIGFLLDRQQMVDTLFNGRAIVGNDHPVHPTLPFFDDSLPQRERDVEQAMALLAEAGYEDLTAAIQVGDILASPDMGAIVEQNAAEAGVTFTVETTANADFYGEHWCLEATGPGMPCGASAEIGIVDYGHRPTPDIFFGRALQTDGDWNSSNYASSEFDDLFRQYQVAIDVDGQREAVSQIQTLLHEDAPALYPFFFDYLGGHDNSVSGVQVTALGHLRLEQATKAEG